jgi:hypothetical protein
VSEGLGLVGRSRPHPVPISSGCCYFLRLEPEGLAGVGGFGSGREESPASGAHFLRLLLLPPAATGGSGCCGRVWVWSGGVARIRCPFPPTVATSSGWNRRVWLESEDVGRSGWSEARRPWVALFPPTVAISSGCNRRTWLESEELRTNGTDGEVVTRQRVQPEHEQVRA